MKCEYTVNDQLDVSQYFIIKDAVKVSSSSGMTQRSTDTILNKNTLIWSRTCGLIIKMSFQ